jgi:hypothetical protein
VEPQELRVEAVKTAASLFHISDFRETLYNGLPNGSDHFKWLVSHLETYLKTGKWDNNNIWLDGLSAYVLQGEPDDGQSDPQEAG